MNKQNSWYKRALNIAGGRRFWWFLLALLVVQAVWIALSGRYPMAFDEDFHLGIIRLYAHHISPFWTNQPESADMFGAVARDPSYLYQYLMSFPYRFLRLLTADQTFIVIIFRFINIGLFAGGMALFRKLLLKTAASRAAVHLSLLVLVLLPVTPFLAAQINYDNLLLPMAAASLLLTVRLDSKLSKSRKLDLPALVQLVILGLLTCLVKYAFLPILFAIFAFLLVRVWQVRHDLKWQSSVYSTWGALGRWSQAGLIAGLVIVAGLFYQRFGVNFIRYHTPVPDCSKVLSVEQCSEYGPWIRDYNFMLNKVPGKRTPLTYSKEWLYGMWLRTFFAVGGPSTKFESRGPLLLPGVAAIVFAVFGFVAFCLKAKQLLSRYSRTVIWLFLSVIITYLVFLWVDEYQAYARTGQPVAINGRYLMPVLPLVILLMVLAANELTKSWPKLQAALLTVCLLCLIWGGGVLTFILRSNDSWYWPNHTVHSANGNLRRVLAPITPGSRRYDLFLR